MAQAEDRDEGTVTNTIGEIGYWMHPDARGRKVMSTAVQLVIGHAFRRVEDPDLVVVQVKQQVVQPEPTPAAAVPAEAAVVAEPEVITKKKEKPASQRIQAAGMA